MRGSWRFARKILFAALGVLLLLVGIAGLVLPGPGLLIMFAGVAVLALEFEWAARRVDFIRDKAMDAAEYGVANWFRILISAAGAVGVFIAGIVWIIDPTIPEVWIIGNHLPFGGVVTGVSMIASSFIAFFLLGYSYRRFHKENRFRKAKAVGPT
ncbi:PGPGW domain-containing protein [Solicola gregarius]|uniref:PGPGW domain-containing protein n=1 Tax=Solicola gregarius TaxID=2908642 RepID=A0AA46TJW6_9ACTN|nr:PGPGW domain-containing protein [Solicola gregarius]UYM06682.1 PGPGW domain-containing protein [Solicola gregarius]